MASDWPRPMLRSSCSDVVDNYVMTCHGLTACDWRCHTLRLDGLDRLHRRCHMLRLDGLDWLHRPDNALWNRDERYLRNQCSTRLNDEGLVRLLRDRRLRVRNRNAGHQRQG